MDALLIIIAVLLTAALVLLVMIFLTQKNKNQSGQVDQVAAAINLLKAELLGSQSKTNVDLRDSLDKAHAILNDRLSDSTSSLDKRLAVLGELENKLGKLTSQAENIENVGKNIQSLSQLLRPPSLRGPLGELLLENLLRDMLPADTYEIQYRFSDNNRVDAVVRIGDKLLPVDAKFPLESFEKIVESPDDDKLQNKFSTVMKRMIDEIAGKYIRPGENTTQFALMYIPSEAVYYQLVSQKNQKGYEYALSKNVIPSSPSLFYAFLCSIAQLEAQLVIAGSGISTATRELLAELDKIIETTGDLERFHQKMKGSLRVLSANMEKASRQLDLIQNNLVYLKEPLAGKHRSADISSKSDEPTETESQL